MRKASEQLPFRMPSVALQTLGDLVELQRGFDLTAAERKPGTIPVIGGGGANGFHAVANVRGPGVALARSGSGFGNAWWVDTDFWAHNTIMFVKNFKGNDPKYAYYVLDWINFSEHNSGGAQPSLNRNFIYPIPVHIPPLPEQCKIAEILRTWDEAIEKLEALRAFKEALYSTLADGLIFGTLRSGHGDWKLHRLGEVTRELTRRNNDGNLGRELVMGVTNSRGIVPMRAQTIGSDLTRYKILPPRAFAYNPMRINVGSIAMLRLPSDVLVSPDYVLFECIPGKLEPDYLDHLRQSHFWAHYINAGGSGSVRTRTYYDDLAALRLKLPEFPEQQKISAVLNTSQAEIALVVAEIETLTRQKRGLMQKLLTGEWRVAA